MTAEPILAFDLGKYKCVACAYDRATAAAEYRTLPTSRAEVERLIRATRSGAVVIEACTLAGWVHDLCGELGVACKVANTAEGWKCKHAKRKTNRDDALRLAQLEALGQLPAVVVPAKRVREWRALTNTTRRGLLSVGSSSAYSPPSGLVTAAGPPNPTRPARNRPVQRPNR